jgi:transcriptional regulator with XRE-family HTH domain
MRNLREGIPYVLWNSLDSFTPMNEARTMGGGMRRSSLTRHQAQTLARLLRERRAELGYSIRQVAGRADINLATIVRLERGEILTPQPDTLKALATALDLSVTDLFALAEWLPERELPNFRPYLRAKYKELPEEAVAEMETFFERLAKKHGMQGPADGEDER